MRYVFAQKSIMKVFVRCTSITNMIFKIITRKHFNFDNLCKNGNRKTNKWSFWIVKYEMEKKENVVAPCFGVTDRGLHILLIIWRALRAVRVKYLNKICLQMHKFTVSHSSVFLLLHTYPCFNPPKPETIFSLCDIFFPYLWLFRIFIFLTVYGYFMNNVSQFCTVHVPPGLNTVEISFISHTVL